MALRGPRYGEVEQWIFELEGREIRNSRDGYTKNSEIRQSRPSLLDTLNQSTDQIEALVFEPLETKDDVVRTPDILIGEFDSNTVPTTDDQEFEFDDVLANSIAHRTAPPQAKSNATNGKQSSDPKIQGSGGDAVENEFKHNQNVTNLQGPFMTAQSFTPRGDLVNLQKQQTELTGHPSKYADIPQSQPEDLARQTVRIIDGPEFSFPYQKQHSFLQSPGPQRTTAQQSQSILNGLKLLNDLNDLNDLKLPPIIVSRDQSAGKSSILRGINRTRFPQGGKKVHFLPDILADAEASRKAIWARDTDHEPGFLGKNIVTLADAKNGWEMEDMLEPYDILTAPPDIPSPRKKHRFREIRSLLKNPTTTIRRQKKQIKSKDRRIRSKERLIREQKRVIKKQERLLAQQNHNNGEKQRNSKFWLVPLTELRTTCRVVIQDILRPRWKQLTSLCNLRNDPVISHLSRRWKQRLPSFTKRLTWICKCGHTSYDDFIELEVKATVSLANQLMEAGYISHAQITSSTATLITFLIIFINNALVGIRQRISNIRSPLPTFTTISRTANPPPACLPINQCRWLHMCLKKRPYATKLEPLHVCKDEKQNAHTDASFFKTLRRAYYKSRSWQEKLLFKLSKIEFVEFDLCPEELVDHITPDKLPPNILEFPPNILEYDFMPPPPLKKCPPIGPSHMMHLFTSCSAQPLNTSLYLRHIPKRKENALSFQPNLIDDQTGYGLHFVEKLNSALAVTVMFSVSLVVGIVFAVWWSVRKEDVQGAFGVASYVTSVVTLAVMSWQLWFV